MYAVRSVLDPPVMSHQTQGDLYLVPYVKNGEYWSSAVETLGSAASGVRAHAHSGFGRHPGWTFRLWPRVKCHFPFRFVTGYVFLSAKVSCFWAAVKCMSMLMQSSLPKQRVENREQKCDLAGNPAGEF